VSSYYDRDGDDDLVDDAREAARRIERDRLLRVARGTLAAAETAVHRARRDGAPTRRLAFLADARDRAERVLRELNGASWV
jgi:hypothetical protein